MASFSKKIRKLNKFPKNALIIGKAFGQLEELSEIFDSLFVVGSDSNLLRKRNIIYREDFEFLTSLPDIDFIFVDKDYFEQLLRINQIWRKNRSYLVTEGEAPPDKHIYKFLAAETFAILDAHKHHIFWKFKA
jgi:hypothetical protein